MFRVLNQITSTLLTGLRKNPAVVQLSRSLFFGLMALTVLNFRRCSIVVPCPLQFVTANHVFSGAATAPRNTEQDDTSDKPGDIPETQRRKATKKEQKEAWCLQEVSQY